MACSVDMFDDALQEISVIIRGDTFERFSVSTAATTLAAEHAELTVCASKASLDGAAAGTARSLSIRVEPDAAEIWI